MKINTYDAIVIGTGAAGYNAAIRLKELGCNVAIITEGVELGTSRNTGSDKQTYYKLGLGGDFPDSVRMMAADLFAGGCVDGDNALCEAALSSRCFMKLCELGVPFPHNRFGEYVGYKTDHDPYARATSAGPLTSKFMTEALQKRAEEMNITVYSGLLAIDVLKNAGTVCGLLCLETDSGELAAFRCPDIVMCTGGPAGIYQDSVYPECHTGTTSLALLAGAKAQNLTEWQYGLSSVHPRWNVSGTYMQVLPRFVSVDSQGTEHEFLTSFFENEYDALSAVFLKGYQWPFDSKKVMDGSSVIDILVYRETVLKGRKVFLDFTKNPFSMEEIDFSRLSAEAFEYLHRAQATFGKPIERLQKMNSPAIELYRSFGVDISKEYLEIALCAQHNNGGISVDMWWQSSVRGLFCAGECAGTHGIARPGGSALNAGQVGSLRAAQYIARNGNKPVDGSTFSDVLAEASNKVRLEHSRLRHGRDNADELISAAQKRMSRVAAAIRMTEELEPAASEVAEELNRLADSLTISGPSRIYKYYKLRDILTTQLAVLSAMISYTQSDASSRGSALYYDKNGNLRHGLEEMFRFSLKEVGTDTMIKETFLTESGFESCSRNVRPIPDDDSFFENVWSGFRKNGNIY